MTVSGDTTDRLTVAVLLEKLAPFGMNAGRVGGALLMLAGVLAIGFDWS